MPRSNTQRPITSDFWERQALRELCLPHLQRLGYGVCGLLVWMTRCWDSLFLTEQPEPELSICQPVSHLHSVPTCGFPWHVRVMTTKSLHDRIPTTPSPTLPFFLTLLQALASLPSLKDTKKASASKAMHLLFSPAKTLTPYMSPWYSLSPFRLLSWSHLIAHVETVLPCPLLLLLKSNTDGD